MILISAAPVWSGAVAATSLKVIVTSKPAHSIVAAVMEGIGTPVLLVQGAASPHTFTLKPSLAREISGADVFIRISPSIEPFTNRLMNTLQKGVTVLTLAETPGLTVLERRRGATFPKDAHTGPDHAHHDDEDGASDTDGHVWLDPMNASKLAGAVVAALSAKDPTNTSRYEANAAAFSASVEATTAALAPRMKALAGKPFVVFHDATQYFEQRFGLTAAGSITVSPDIQPSAKRLSAVRKRIRELGATCVFSEPAYKEKLVAAVTEGTSARAGVIDPEALKLEPGPGLYVELLRQLADGFENCLAKTS